MLASETTNKKCHADVLHDCFALEYNLRQCSFGMRHLRDGSRVVTEAMDALAIIDGLEKIAFRIARGDELPWEITHRPQGKVRVISPLGHALQSLANLMTSSFYANCAKFEFNPYITVMLRAFRPYDEAVSGGGPNEIRILDWLVRFVRRVCGSKRFRSVVHKYDRAGENNLRSACQHLAACFAQYSRLLIVRVDLYCANGEDGVKGSLDEVFNRFVRSIRRNRIVPDVITMLHRRECGFERGLHYHVFVVMDGHKHCRGYHYAEAIGQQWMNKCAAAGLDGTYFNNFRRAGQSRFCGLGLVHISDERKLIGVREALRYITKGYYKVKPAGRVKRNFRRCLIKRLGGKFGAPRGAHHNMELVMRILGDV